MLPVAARAPQRAALRRRTLRPPVPMRPPAWAAAACLLVAGAAAGQSRPAAAPSVAAASAPARAASAAPSIELRAQEIRGRPDLETIAQGDVELRRGALTVLADWLSYEQAEDVAWARGHVQVRNPTGIYTGPELRVQVQRFEGYFLRPTYEFPRVKAGGRADRIDFLDSSRSVAYGAWYTSCPRDDPGGGAGDPAWVLRTDRIRLDLDANEGIAEGAVLRFLGVPILALPTLSFPLTEDRKSGWLPPSVNLDNRSGLNLAVPYYWNIAPNRDATLTPHLITKRGLGLDTEFRYLEPSYRGTLRVDLLPDDRVAKRPRHAWQWQHEGDLPAEVHVAADATRVSDDDWWKDFPDEGRSLTPRLLPLRAEAERPIHLGDAQGLAYARTWRWQVLQGAEARVISPYDRRVQLGLQLGGQAHWLPSAAIDYTLTSELNRFELPDRPGSAEQPNGWRWHGVGSIGHAFRGSGVWVTPRLAVNAVSYALDQALGDGRRHASRVVPTFSVDAGLELERETQAFGRTLRQTLEPRLRYVRTPLRDQAGLPNFDSAGKDFNFNSIFSDNAFSGIDRVSDAHQLTAGVTTRVLDAASGVEALRLGVVQRYLFRSQQVTPEGTPFTQRLSDLFLLGSANLWAGVGMEAAVQYSPDLQRPVRSILSGRWSPGAFRTISGTYRYTRGLTEQVEVGWQWPLWKSALAASDGRVAGGAASGGGSCGGTWYTVGRVNYSVKDSRVTDSVLGFEYDAGCWIGRVVAERVSTGRSEATTRLLLQLELVGLSRLGSNPLKVLKDNVPGYRLLRDERDNPTPAPPRYE